MTNFLEKLFIKNTDGLSANQIAKKYGFLCGVVGIITNTLLAVVKIFMGLAINSISVIADAVNNFSDIGTSVVTIIGFHMAGKPADEEHPFGHGRAEYLSALFLSIMVIMVGAQFLKSSWQRIVNPEPIENSIITVVMLVLSILLKIWQSRLYKNFGAKIKSKTLIAASLDSLSDVATTSIVLFGMIVVRFVDFPLDGYVGLIVSALIMYNGWNIVKDVIDPILGTKPDEDQCKEITDVLMKCDGIHGYHDLIIHNYGAGVFMGTVHAEVSDSLCLIDAHEIIDNAEKTIYKELGINVLIHLDPINLDDPKIRSMFVETKKFVKQIDKDMNIHDFRVVCKTESEVIFDFVVPIHYKLNMIEDAKKAVVEFLKEKYDISKVYIEVERGNIIIS